MITIPALIAHSLTHSLTHYEIHTMAVKVTNVEAICTMNYITFKRKLKTDYNMKTLYLLTLHP